MGVSHSSSVSSGHSYSPVAPASGAALASSGTLNLLDPRSPSQMRTPLAMWRRAALSREEAQRVRDMAGLLDPRSPRDGGRTPLQCRLSALSAAAAAPTLVVTTESAAPASHASHVLNFDTLAPSPAKDVSAESPAKCLDPLPELPSPLVAALLPTLTLALLPTDAAPSVPAGKENASSMKGSSVASSAASVAAVVASPAGKSKARRALHAISGNVGTRDSASGTDGNGQGTTIVYSNSGSPAPKSARGLGGRHFNTNSSSGAYNSAANAQLAAAVAPFTVA